MVERLFIHNYKGFVNFEMKFGRIALLVGRNGSGKSSLIDVMHALLMVIKDGSISDFFKADRRFRFGNFLTQQFELDVRLGESLFRYRLEIGFEGPNERPFVVREEFSRNGEGLLSVREGELRIGNSGPLTIEKHRGGLATFFWSHLPEPFTTWAWEFVSVKLVPSIMRPHATEPSALLTNDGSDFVAFYETVSNADTSALVDYLATMRQVLPGLRTINLKPLYKGKIWEAEFDAINGGRGTFALNELSDGQISLVVYYALLHFWLRRGRPVALDEPDNYLALAEIEPFLHEIEDAVDQSQGQVFLISHHPEFYNHWATDRDRCRYLARTPDGFVVAHLIDWDEHYGLAPAEVVARGWEDA